MHGEDVTPGMPIASLLKRGEIKVLVVEDDPFLRNILVQKLKEEGYAVSEAFNGKEAIEHIRARPPHLILLDLMLPVMDGFEVLAFLRGDPAVSAIPVLVLSNLSSTEDIQKAQSLGVEDFLVKANHTPKEIIERVKEIIERCYLKK